MRLTKNKSGQGMTEYIIIIAIVAVAALLVTMMFGKQIRTNLAKITGALGGQETEGMEQVEVDETAHQRMGMGDFDETHMRDDF